MKGYFSRLATRSGMLSESPESGDMHRTSAAAPAPSPGSRLDEVFESVEPRAHPTETESRGEVNPEPETIERYLPEIRYEPAPLDRRESNAHKEGDPGMPPHSAHETSVKGDGQPHTEPHGARERVSPVLRHGSTSAQPPAAVTQQPDHELGGRDRQSALSSGDASERPPLPAVQRPAFSSVSGRYDRTGAESVAPGEEAASVQPRLAFDVSAAMAAAREWVADRVGGETVDREVVPGTPAPGNAGLAERPPAVEPSVPVAGASVQEPAIREIDETIESVGVVSDEPQKPPLPPRRLVRRRPRYEQSPEARTAARLSRHYIV
jgi:hypothetical protein